MFARLATMMVSPKCWLLFVTIFQYSKSVCDTGWAQQGLHCYYFSDYSATYEEAQTFCRSQYAELAEIEDDGANTFVYENAAILHTTSVWIGYQRVAGTIWRWDASGTAGQYQKWDIGEPDGEGDCARITPYIVGAWRDWPCIEKLNFACKKFADCGPPMTMTHGDLSFEPEGTVVGQTVYQSSAVVTYTCTSGFEYLDGSASKSSICSIGGVWEPDLTNDQCEPKQCQPPATFERVLSNATATDRDFGMVVAYQCQPGYWFDQFELGIIKHYTCREDKQWHQITSKENEVELGPCSEVICVRPVTSNARANTSLNSFGVTALYECDIGYRYDDNTTEKNFYCGSVGWEPPPEACNVLVCPNHTVSGAIPSTLSRNYDTTVVWNCEEGKRYSDTTTYKIMKCLITEQWDNEITDECFKKKCEAVPPNATETNYWDYNSSLTYRFGDKINYRCIDEFFYSDQATVKFVECNEDGVWSPGSINECLGELIELKIGVTHEPTEVEGAVAYGTISMGVVVALVIAIVVLDVATISRHLARMRDNVCPKKPEDMADIVTADEPGPSSDGVV